MKKKVVFLAKFLGRDSGGTSSIMDLIEGFKKLGNEVFVGLDKQSPKHFNQNVRKIYPISIGAGRIFRIPAHLRYPDQSLWNQYISNIKAIKRDQRTPFQKILLLFYRLILGLPFLIRNKIAEKKTELKGWEWIKSADIIIYASFLAPSAIHNIKANSKAIVVRNHAGAKELMSFWIKHYSKLKANNNETLYVSYLKRFDKVLFQSNEQANEFEECSKSLKGKALVVPPSCDEKAIDIAKMATNPFKHNTQNITVVGSIQERKGQDIAIKIFESLASQHLNLHIHFVGHINPESQFCHNFLKQIENSQFSQRIHFHGHRKDYLRFMVNSTILLQPSKQEGVSRILRETMYMKVPIVAFNISGTRDLLQAGTEAILVEPFNVEELKLNITLLLEDPKKCKELTENAFGKYLKNNSKVAYLKSIGVNFNCK